MEPLRVRSKLISARRIAAGVALAGALFYVLFELRNVLRGVSLRITEPTDGATIATLPFHLRGSVRDATRLELNGRQIFTDPAGNFDESLRLPLGYTILDVQATDTFGRTVMKRLRLQVVTYSTHPHAETKGE